MVWLGLLAANHIYLVFTFPTMDLVVYVINQCRHGISASYKFEALV
jgi:hypothetical protein